MKRLKAIIPICGEVVKKIPGPPAHLKKEDRSHYLLHSESIF